MLVSYDIFDTILYRKVLYSTDIFKIMEEFLLKNGKWNYNKSFVVCRKKAEFILRVINKNEIKIDDIYDYISKFYSVDSETVDYCKQLEFDTEKKYSFLNTGLVDEIINKIETGDRVILISDMYWSSKYIKELLSEKNKIFHSIDIYVSCDYNASKRNEKLFRKVREIENIEFSEWMHFGDNSWSDVKIPSRLGIKTKKVENNKYYDFEKTIKKCSLNVSECYGVISQSRLNKSDAYVLGVSVAGPIVYEYVEWVINLAQKENIKILYFVLRDGYILKKVADIIINARGLGIITEYVFGSRVAWRLPQLSVEKIMKLSVWDKSNWIFRDPAYVYVPLEKLGFQYNETLEYLGEDLANKTLHTFKEFKEVINQALTNLTFCKVLEGKIKASGDNLYEYIYPLISVNESFAFVDTNSTGKTQNDLNDFLESRGQNKKLRFIYNVFLSNVSKDPEIQFVFKNNRKDEERLPEALLRAPYSQCYGYKHDNTNGRMIPFFKDENTNSWSLSFDYNEYTKGVISFCVNLERDNKDRVSNNRKALNVSEYADVVFDVVNFKIESKDVWKQMSVLPFYPDLEGRERGAFFPELELKDVIHPFSRLIYFPKGSFYIKGGLWKVLYKVLYSMVSIKRELKMRLKNKSTEKMP